MKMKKVILGCSVLAATAILLTSCNKDKTVAEPVQDTEFQSTKDVIYANTVASDIEQIVAYMGEGQLLTKYLQPAPGSSGSIPPPVTSGNSITVVFQGSVTCRDGKKRDGSITLVYTSSPASYSANATRDPGYVATVYLNNFWQDGWSVAVVDQFVVKNVTAFNYAPASDKLKWTIKGKLAINNVADASKNMTWEGDMTKTLANTNNSAVFAPTKLLPIAWSSTTIVNNAKLEYGGSSKGITANGTAYTFSITEESPLVRDYNCSPDKVLGVTTTTANPPVVTPVYSEWHPFISGVASFTTGSLAPRLVDFGVAGDCDNAVKITIKGVETPVDLMK